MSDASWRKEFAKRLRQAIEEKGISQTDLCIEADITVSAMSRYVNATRTPNARRVAAIASALGLPIEQLICF